MTRILIMAMLVMVVLGGFFSCDSSNESPRLSGTYTETYPVRGRTKLTFSLFENKVRQTDEDGLTDIYTYRISKNKIILTLTTDPDENSASTEHDFRLMSKSKFTIENLYASIPESSTVQMTFEK